MVPRYFAYLKKLTVAAAGLIIFDLPAEAADPPSPLRKIEDRIIYQAADFYSAFPSIVRRRDAGFQGHPHHALRLPDQRVLLVCGYRHRPYGIRARLLDPECTQAAAAAAFVLRDDGGSSDLGYPWVTRLSGNRLLVVYYFNREDGIRHIAGTVLELRR